MKLEIPDDLFDEEEISNTPRRWDRFWQEWQVRDQEFIFTTFPNTEEVHDMVIVKDIPFYSLCAHHILPFFGTAHIGYVPGSKIAGISKFPRMVNKWAHRPQNQERLTKQIADDLEKELGDAWGVIVVMEARHLCSEMRGVKSVGNTTVTAALRGKFMNEPEAKSEFLSLIGK